MEKLSIIIPNYNGANYIETCLNSIVEQNYDYLEIIIIDDGSEDNSKEIIKNYKDKHNDINIIDLYQDNMNASIARNVGINIAKGKYVMFLDSDDLFVENVLKNNISKLNKSGADLLMGNNYILNENGFIEKSNNIDKSEVLINEKKVFSKLVSKSPLPSNKIFLLDIIKKNNIYFGNVRIGQDLNFYLKYLLCCKKILLVEEYLYKYRIVNNSMSRLTSFRIFDIVESFANVKSFYIKNNSLEIYNEFIQIVEMYHYFCEMEKQSFFSYRKERKMIINFFSIALKKISYKDIKNYDSFYRTAIKQFQFKLLFKSVYCSKIYPKIKKIMKYIFTS